MCYVYSTLDIYCYNAPLHSPCRSSRSPLVLSVGSSEEELDAGSNAGGPETSTDKGGALVGVEDVDNVEQGPSGHEQASVEGDSVLGNTGVQCSKLFERERERKREREQKDMCILENAFVVLVGSLVLVSSGCRKEEKKMSINRVAWAGGAWHIQISKEPGK